MKRFWIGTALLIAILAGGGWTSRYMSRTHTPCAMDLEHAAQCAMKGDWEGAAVLADRAQQFWQHSWHMCAMMSDHDPMDEIDALFSQLEIYRLRGETSAFSASCRYLAQRLMDMGESFRLTWWNLL